MSLWMSSPTSSKTSSKTPKKHITGRSNKVSILENIHLNINPQDTSIHTHRASSVVSRTTSKSSIETISVTGHRQLTKKDGHNSSRSLVKVPKESVKYQEDDDDEKKTKNFEATSVGDLNTTSSIYTTNDQPSEFGMRFSESYLDLITLGKKLELSSLEERLRESRGKNTDTQEQENKHDDHDEREDVEDTSEQEKEQQELELEEEEEEETEKDYDKLEENDEEEKRRSKLIERYLTLQSEYTLQLKKNSYLQDKLYGICIRKGKIILKKDADEGKRKRRMNESKNTKQLNDDGLSHNNVTESDEEEKNKQMDNHDDDHSLRIVSPDSSTEPGIEGFRIQTLFTKYQKIIEQFSDTMKSKLDIAEIMSIHLTEFERKRRESEEKCNVLFGEFMNKIESHSSEAINANTGRHLSSRETAQYVREMNKLFDKLRNTTEEFYRNWHGLNYSLKSLEETETERSDGLHVLEYEQLCGENEGLKDKAEYRELELVKAKHKISHCVQVLAHFKETERHMDTTITQSSTNLSTMNKKIKQLAEIMDVVTIMYSILSDEEKVLHRESELFENVKLMKDFEQTNHRTIQLRKIRKNISQQVLHHEFDIKVLEDQINTIKNNGPYFQEIAEREKLKAAEMAAKKLKNEEQRKADKHQKMEKLLILLERRTTEPWKNILDTKTMMPQTKLVCDNNNHINYCNNTSPYHLIVK